eukprot:7151776-Lingulodinium_polyedra.AAC.1
MQGPAATTRRCNGLALPAMSPWRRRRKQTWTKSQKTTQKGWAFAELKWDTDTVRETWQSCTTPRSSSEGSPPRVASSPPRGASIDGEES